MLFILSPTKNMKLEDHTYMLTLPAYLEDTKQIVNVLKTYTASDIAKLMKVNEKIASLTTERFQSFQYHIDGYPAIFTYDGLQFKSMHTEMFHEEDLAYAQKHVRILSGLYGIVKPMDSIYPYRLEMLTKLAVDEVEDLYAFWGQKLIEGLRDELCTHEHPYIIDLASKEYSKCVTPYLRREDTYICITFKVRKEGKLKTISTQAKMARGKMIHYIVKNKIDTLAGIRAFREDGYEYIEELSSISEYVFVKENEN